jgi:hypothetical protein
MNYYHTLFTALAKKPKCVYFLTPIPFRQTSKIFVGVHVYQVDVIHQDDDHQLVKFTLDTSKTFS